jgi:hypothetical protein
LKVYIQNLKIQKLQDRVYIESLRENDSIVSNQNFTKEYKSKEKSLLIQNKDKSKMIDLELLSPYRKTVGEGDSILVADMMLKDWEDRNTLFDKLDFYDAKNGYQRLDKQFVFKYVKEKTIQISVDIPNAPKETFVEKQIADWDNAIEFTTLNELPHKNIRVGIFTKTILNEKIEWLPTIDGFDIYEWAAYDVTEIDSLEHDVNYGVYNSLAMIDSTHFMLSYTGDGVDGYIKTFSIDGGYNITEIDSLEHNVENGKNNSLVKIDSTHFMLAYYGRDLATGSNGYLKVFTVDGSYNISETSCFEHDINTGMYNSLVMIDSTHFILAYRGNNEDGYIKVFSMDGSYNITQESSLEHDINDGADNSLVMIDSTHFILAYEGVGEDGFIKTFSMDGSYNVTEIDSLEHDILYGSANSLVTIDSTHFMLACAAGASYRGYIKVFTIDGGYNITQESSLEHDINYGFSNSIVKIDSTHFMLAYASGASYHGYIKVFTIDGGYNITQESSLEHDINDGSYNSLIKINSAHFMLAYAGDGYDGYVKIFNMEGGPNTAPNIPTLNSPPHGSIDQSITPNLIVNYSDADSDFCTKFDLLVDDDFTFASPEISETNYSFGGPWISGGTVTYSVSSGLSASTKYYWKINAYDGAAWSGWSNGTWEFTTGTAPPAIKTIISKGDDAYRIEIDDDLNVTAYINTKSVTYQITKAWHHITLTYDKDAGGPDEIKLYIDGVFGKIDNVAIYDKCITTAQIQQHYAAGAPAHGIALNDK